MNKVVERMARGERLGFWGWYAKLHVPRCPQCNAALAALQRAIQALGTLRAEESAQPGEAFWNRLDEKLAAQTVTGSDPDQDQEKKPASP